MFEKPLANEANRRAFGKARRNLNKFAAKINKSGMLGMHEVAKRIIKTARKNAPVDTGALRRSGRVRKLKSGSRITFGGASAPRYVGYAGFVEEGTFSRAPTYFLRRAMQAHKKEIPKQVVKSVGGTWMIYAKLGSTRRL